LGENGFYIYIFIFLKIVFMLNFEILAGIFLVLFACGDLFVGVANDAVNFLNSAIGSKVSSRKIIMLTASIGLLIGATFSDGIIEIARKGIFHPQFFSVTEVLMIFLAVAISDVVLLDLFSTFGLPTSTTVSLVFELLGAAFILAFLKLDNFDQAWQAINSASAIKIITGIFLSIAISLVVGLIIQFITRLIFSFSYQEKFKKWGFLWSGIALSALVFFILIKGGSHATFMSAATKGWINEHTGIILLMSLIIFSFISQILIYLKHNILKWIILIGTGSLAMAFAGNDLANFIGVSVAGIHALLGADLSADLSTPPGVLLGAGIVMIIAMVTSKKANTVTNTQLRLASHKKDVLTQWNSNALGKGLTKLGVFIFDTGWHLLPTKTQKWFSVRWTHDHARDDNPFAFDLLRAAVNLMTAAALISFATSQKLPLSTTYVTFMVAMGTSLADGAWDRHCAPARVAGVFNVIGGWFTTAILAFMITGLAVTVLYFLNITGLFLLVLVSGVIVYKLFKLHRKKGI
jgi:phosphate/sulfate permease